jgi:hypothetical protein
MSTLDEAIGSDAQFLPNSRTNCAARALDAPGRHSLPCHVVISETGPPRLTRQPPRTVLSPGRVERTMPNVLDRLRFARDHRWAPARMSAFLDHDLTAHQHVRMERHLGECRRCRGLLTGLQLVVAALHRLPSPPDGDVTRITASVRVRLSEPV